MLSDRLIVLGSMLAAALLVSGCESSAGSLVSDEVRDILDPAQTVGEGPSLGAANGTLIPRVTSVSPTVTIRGSNLILIIHGEDLSDAVSVVLDNEVSPCVVNTLQAGETILTNIIEADCNTGGISNRVVTVSDEAGAEVPGSPLSLTVTSITVDTTSSQTSDSPATATPDAVIITPTPSENARDSENSDELDFSENDNTGTDENADSPNTGSNNDSNDGSETLDFSGLTQPPTSGTDNQNSNTNSETNNGTDSLDFSGIQSQSAAPVNLRVVNNKGQLSLSWNAISQAEGYNVYISTNTNPQPGVRSTKTYFSNRPSLTINDIEINNAYYVVVTAFVNNTESARSNELKADVEPTRISPYGALTDISVAGNNAANLGIELSSTFGGSTDQSGDGRFTVFVSRSENLVPQPSGGNTQIYVHDKADGSVQLVSVAYSGEASNADATNPRISRDGTTVVFESTASNLVSGTNTSGRTNNIYVRNLQSQFTYLVTKSVAQLGESANFNSFAPVIDHTGSNILFSSYADDLTTDQKSLNTHVYHYNTSSNSLRRLPTYRSNLVNAGLNASATVTALTPDGKYAFYSFEVPGTSPSLHRVELANLQQTDLVLASMLGLGGSFVADVSNDGNLALVSYANGNMTGIHNVATSSFAPISQGSSHAKPVGISGDGQYAVFWSQNDLLPNNVVAPRPEGSHFIFYTQSNNLQETSRNIRSISNDGNVLLFADKDYATSEYWQLRSGQR